MGKSKIKDKSTKNVDDVIPYASKEEEEDFLNFSDNNEGSENEMDCSDDGNEEQIQRACDIGLSDEDLENEDEENEGEDLDEEMSVDLDTNDDSDQTVKKTEVSEKELKEQQMERNKRTIFIGNITSKVNQKVLKQLFNSKKAAGEGAVESVRIRGAVPEGVSNNSNDKRRAVILKKFANQDNQVLCAYVVLKSADLVEKCLKLNNEVVDGKHIRVDRIRGKKMQFKQGNCVFIGNLPFNTNEEVVRDAFEKCGEIVNVRLVRNKADGKIKGFGYVEFVEPMSVDFALKMNDSITIDKRQIRVQKWTDSKTQKERRSQSSKTKGEFKPVRVVAPSNLKGQELKEYMLLKKRKMIKRAKKKKDFIKEKRTNLKK